jgi:predicted SAM-dependent methyltransferase
MEPIKLHIGGQEPHPEWKILDVEPRPEVDYVANANDLSLFESNSVESIYASHVLEHFYYGLNNQLINTLKEWHRVLNQEVIF